MFVCKCCLKNTHLFVKKIYKNDKQVNKGAGTGKAYCICFV